MKKKILMMLFACLLLVMPVRAENHPARLIDDADVLTSQEEQVLLKRLDQISESYQCDVVIVVMSSLEGKDVVSYADDYYDDHGYGMGSGDDGILLLLDMEYREWAISTYGFGISAFNDEAQEDMMDDVLSYLGRNQYANGFHCFSDWCDRILEDARNGSFYGVSEYPSSNGGYQRPSTGSGSVSQDDTLTIRDLPRLLPIMLLISVGGGMLVALIIVSTMKRKHKTVHRAAGAADYIADRGLTLSESREMFLFRNISRRPIPRQNNQPRSSSFGGHSTIHTSSSGRSHGGSHGHF